MRNQIDLYPPSLFQQLDELGLADWLPALQADLSYRLSSENHGDYEKWYKALQQLPDITPSEINLARPAIQVGNPDQLTEQQKQQLTTLCQTFHPWRKGPFDLFGIYIDTEWRSDWKWDRLKEHITPLANRTVLDIGCGSGYHCWRMRGAGARFVLGIDPTLVFVMQYLLVQHYIQDEHVQVLPLGIDDLPSDTRSFDTVFSMGLLYHRRNPQTHLQELAGLLRDDGELVLETLVIEDKHLDVLVPQGRYAQMRNVWAIPSVETLSLWLAQSGYRNIRCIDVSKTSTGEQRVTDWMQFQSLADFLDPSDQNKTIEGYPAPVRAIMIANK